MAVQVAVLAAEDWPARPSHALQLQLLWNDSTVKGEHFAKPCTFIGPQQACLDLACDRRHSSPGWERD